MKTTVRAAWAVGLLAGFYAIAFGLLAVMVGVDVAVLLYAASVPALAVLLSMTVVAFVVVLQAVFVSTRRSPDSLPGVAAGVEEQPRLWARARELAAAAGTEAPDEIRIDDQANAAVMQDTVLLGLVPRTRRLFIGAPLLLALSPAQLDAVLAHEFGHYSNHDTWLLPIVNRGRKSVLKAVEAAAGAPRQGPSAAPGRVAPGRYLIYRLFRAYAERYLAATQAISRQQEFEADRISAQVAGAQTAIAVLDRMHGVQTSYRFYVEQFLAEGLKMRLVPEPPQILGGFGALLAAVGESSAGDEREGREKQDKFDSHPALGDRVAALKALPDEARAVDPGGRAIDLLDRADEVLASVGLRMLGARYEEASRADWDTIADAAARERSRSAAQPLIDAIHLMTGTAGTLTAFLDLVDAGHLETVRFRLLTPAQARYAGAGDVALELARKALMTTLPPLVLAELGDAGVVRWTRSWSGEAPALVISPALSAELDAAYAALLAEVPSAEPLRRAVIRVPADPGDAASADTGTQAD